jgi:hypothetical protein
MWAYFLRRVRVALDQEKRGFPKTVSLLHLTRGRGRRLLVQYVEPACLWMPL